MNVVIPLPRKSASNSGASLRASITSNTYWDWWMDHAFLLVPAQGYVGKFLATFEEFPPRQKAASFTVDQVMKQLEAVPSGG